MSDSLRHTNVLFKRRLAGRLSETPDGGTLFAYAANWTETIACALPADRREHPWPRGLHPFFQHLGPEGWLRQTQARGAHVDSEDDLGLLLHYGADCIGAVGVTPVSQLAPEPPPMETVSPGRTLSGVQRKLLVVADGESGRTFVPAGPDGPAPYIAKFNNPDVDTLVRNEALALAWTAAVFGPKEVTEQRIGRVGPEGEQALIVTRFDRTTAGEPLRLEDFAQILSKPRGRGYEGKYDSSYEEAASVIVRYSARPEIDLLKFFERVVAFAVVGNCDAHLKNFSLLETPTGLRLSPIYDVVNTTLFPGIDRTFGLAIGEARRPLDTLARPIFSDLGRAIGLRATTIEKSLKALEKKITKARSVLTPPRGEPEDGFVHRFRGTVDNGCLRIFAV